MEIMAKQFENVGETVVERRQQRNSEAWWRHTTTTLLGVSFDTYLRSRGDVLMERCHYVPLRRRHGIPIRRREDVPLRCLDDVPVRCRWVFHLRGTGDIAGTYGETSLRCRRDVLLPSGFSVYIYISFESLF